MFVIVESSGKSERLLGCAVWVDTGELFIFIFILCIHVAFFNEGRKIYITKINY